jgi:hypothetical protein
MRGFDRRRDAPKFLRTGYLAHHIRCLPAWSSTYQAPDPIHFADYSDLADEFAAIWVRDEPMDPPVPFGYPKPTGPLRTLTLLTPRDNARLRAVAGAVIEVAEGKLPKNVFSARVAAMPPMWKFKVHPYYKFIREVKRAIREWSCTGMVRTDVRDFFPSLQAEAVLRCLWDAGCDEPSVIFLVNAMMECEDRHICRGLPIGPEASAVIGSFYLLPVDLAMGVASCDQHRYMDDMAYLHGAAMDRDWGLALFDEALDAVYLKRSEEKTHHASNPLDALALVERTDLAYVVAYTRRIPGISIDFVKEAFDEVARGTTVDVPAMRSCLNALGSAHDPYAVQALVERRDLFDAEPKAAGDYLCLLPPSRVLANELCNQLESRAREATRLHVLRAVECHGTGTKEAVELLERAASHDEVGPVRAWALAAYSSSDGYNAFDLLEATASIESKEVRRAAILSLRRSPRVGRKFGARLLSGGSQDLALSSRWALSHAAA